MPVAAHGWLPSCFGRLAHGPAIARDARTGRRGADLSAGAVCLFGDAVFVTRPMSRRGPLPPVQNGRNSSKGGSNDGSGSRNALQRGTASAVRPVPMVHGVPLAKASGIAIQPRLCS